METSLKFGLIDGSGKLFYNQRICWVHRMCNGNVMEWNRRQSIINGE